MISAFVNRRYWAAALIGLLLGPIVGMLYLGRGVAASAYVAVWMAVYGLPLSLAHLGLLPFEAETAILLLVIIYRVGGAIHCERAARSIAGAVPSAWFARWYAIVLAGLVLPIGLRMVVWEPFNMPSASMEPTLNVGDYFIVEKVPYLLREPQRGDLVLFLHSDEESPYVKRLMGLPGDRLQLREGSLYLNGQRLARSEVKRHPEIVKGGQVYRESLPSRRSYLIREISDSRFFDDTDIYEVPADHYFFLGDNRDNSLDSRSDLGVVPAENLLGRVVVVLWNRAAQKFRLAAPE